MDFLLCMDRLPTLKKCCCCSVLAGTYIIALYCAIAAASQPFYDLAGKDIIIDIHKTDGQSTVDIIEVERNNTTFRIVLVILTWLILGIGSVLLFFGVLMQIPILILVFQWAVVIFLILDTVSMLVKISDFVTKSYYFNVSSMITSIIISIGLYTYFIIITNSHRMSLTRPATRRVRRDHAGAPPPINQ